MRCKITGKAFPAIWTHPDLDGQMIAAYTRKEARFLLLAIVEKDFSEEGFSRVGAFANKPRIISTFSAFKESFVGAGRMNLTDAAALEDGYDDIPNKVKGFFTVAWWEN